MLYDECQGCREKATDIEFMQNQLDEIRDTLESYAKTRDHWDWDNLIEDIMGILEK